jgi:hypothetical protein
LGNRLVRAQPPAWPHAIGNAIALILATFNKNTYLQAQFLRLQARRGPKKAAIAVAASILTAIYHIATVPSFAAACRTLRER